MQNKKRHFYVQEEANIIKKKFWYHTECRRIQQHMQKPNKKNKNFTNDERTKGDCIIQSNITMTPQVETSQEN